MGEPVTSCSKEKVGIENIMHVLVEIYSGMRYGRKIVFVS